VLTIAHRLSTVMTASEILVLEQGRIVEQGPHDELLRRNGVYARIFELQQDEVDARLLVPT
jgi:ABC-type multidrug transport system fused ATPase/permease subunit